MTPFWLPKHKAGGLVTVLAGKPVRPFLTAKACANWCKRQFGPSWVDYSPTPIVVREAGVSDL